ncbi:cation diffusion facilitator family transporter [Candidatus Gracilibacteria bacterium]|nr:cation diffusion facilitator family transporter [Candidatus Gracilibacteria bacterium]
MTKQTTHTVKQGEHIALLGIIANIGLATIKFLGGIFGNSYALIADAIESATDIIGSGIVYLGVRYAQKPADHDHPYGHGKTEPMAGLAVSILLIFAVIEIATGAIARIRNPEIGIPEMWTLWILLGVIILKGGLFVRAFVIGKSLKSTAITGDAFHHLSDAVTTGIALLGTLLALFGGTIFTSAADWAALVASVFMCYNIYHIGGPAIRELLDERNDIEMEQSIRELISQDSNIAHIGLCWVRKSGFDRIVELRLLINGEKTVREGHVIAHTIEDLVIQNYPNVTHISTHIEPTYEIIE